MLFHHYHNVDNNNILVFEELLACLFSSKPDKDFVQNSPVQDFLSKFCYFNFC